MKEIELLEKAIADKDLDKAKQLMVDNPELKPIINEKLYALAIKSQFFMSVSSEDEKTFQTIVFLLEIGADPNYRKNGSQLTLLEKAAGSNDLPFAKLLLAKEADLLTGSVDREELDPNVTEDQVAKSAFQENHFPAQRMREMFLSNCKKYKDLYNLLSEATLNTELGKTIQDNFREVFKNLISEIRAAKEKADGLGKRLMILVGEEHYDFNALVIETMAYLAASNWCDINKVLVEKDKDLLDHYNKTGEIKTRGASWIVSLGLFPFLKNNLAEIVPIDESRSSVKDVTSEAGVYTRDKMMAFLANEVKSNVLGIVGGGHMYGLMTKTDLTANFHVLAISTMNDSRAIKDAQKSPKNTTLEAFDKLSHEQKAREFDITFPDKVRNICAFKQRGFNSLVSPDMAISIVSSLFEELKRELSTKKKM